MSTTVAPQTATGTCQRHSDAKADWRCTSCGAEFCDNCMQDGVRDRACLESCPNCREFCRRVTHTGARGPGSAGAMIADAVVYPFRGHGVFLIIIGGLMLGVLEVLSVYNIYFFISLFLMVFGLGYLANYMFKIVGHTIQGENDLPTWPDFTDFMHSCVVPFFQMLVIFATCLLPAVGPLIGFGYTPLGIICSILFILSGCFYMPMALLAVALNGSISALSSRIVWPAIRSVIGPYLVTYIALVVMFTVSGMIQGFVTENVPLFGIFLNSIVSTFFIAMEMRLLGLLYVCHRDKIDLF